MPSGLWGVLLIGLAALPFTACTNTPPPPPPAAPVVATVAPPPVARPPRHRPLGFRRAMAPARRPPPAGGFRWKWRWRPNG